MAARKEGRAAKVLLFQIFRRDGTLLAGGKQHGLFHDVIRIGVKAVGVAVGACRSGFGYDGAAGMDCVRVRRTSLS